MPKLAALQKLRRLFHRRHCHGQKIAAASFDSSTDETLRISESELSLSPSTCNSNSDRVFSVNTSHSNSFDHQDADTLGQEQVQEAQTATLTLATTSSKPQKRKKKAVSFSQVQIRHYELILGENPGIRYPLSIGWRYHLEEHQHIDDYETKRAEEKKTKEQDKVPRLYVPPGEAAEDHEDDPHEDGDDGLLEELTLYERRMRLRTFGYSEAYLRTQERQRQCRIALEWGGGGGPRFPHCDAFIQRYSRE